MELREFRRFEFTDEFAVAQHRDTVGNGIHLIHEVRDEYEAETLLAQASHHFEQLGDFVLIEARCRLVENEQFRVHIERAGDGHHLLECERARRNGAMEIEVNFQPLQRAFRAGVQRLPVNETEAARLASEHDVLRDGKLGDEIDFLIHRRDAQFLRLARRL